MSEYVLSVSYPTSVVCYVAGLWRPFAIAAPRVWNSLPYKVTSAQSLCSFRRHLKTFLFQRSFPDIIVTLVDLAIVFFLLRPL